MSAIDTLGKAEREHFLEAVEASLAVRRMTQFFLWAQGPLQRLVPHEVLACAAAAATSGVVSFHKLSSTPQPTERQFAELCRPGHGLLVRMMSAWARDGAPLFLSPHARCIDGEADWPELACAYGLGNVAAHGVRNPAGRVATYFSFARVGAELGPRLQCLLDLIVPHLHQTLTRVLIEERRATRPAPVAAAVTRRESEILAWLRDGRTNRDIARILDVSPNTVKNHVQKILRKMAVESRSHAVARAISLGILAPS